MKTDVLLIPMGTTFAAMRDAALAAEESGFDGVWTWDHLRETERVDGAGCPEAWTTLTALAAVTTRITLGPLVLNVANRPPGVLANMAATFQAVSGGRLVLGIGAGGSRRTPYAVEQQAIGQTVEADAVRAQRVVDAVTLIRRLWSGHAGFLEPDPPPPIVVGGFGPRMAAIAGAHGDGFNTQAFHPQLADLVGVARDAHATSGRTTPFGISVFAGFEERWLDPASRARQMLDRVGVDRVILLLSPPYDLAAIGRAKR